MTGGEGGDGQKHSLKAENMGGGGDTNTRHLVLTAPELGGVVKVGEE